MTDGAWWQQILFGFFVGIGFTISAALVNALIGLIASGRRASP